MNEHNGLDPGSETADFLWEVHRYTNEYIRFADTKAGFIAAVATALMGSIVASSILDPCFRTKVGAWSVLQWTGWLGLILLAIALALSICAIGPRLWKDQAPGFIYWGSISEHGTAQNFTRQVRGLSDRDKVISVAEHLFVLSDIAKQKYTFIDLALFTGVAGGAISGIVLLLQHASHQ